MTRRITDRDRMDFLEWASPFLDASSPGALVYFCVGHEIAIRRRNIRAAINFFIRAERRRRDKK